MQIKSDPEEQAWEDVSIRMHSLGHRVGAPECCSRWNVYVKFQMQGMRVRVEWTDEEVSGCVDGVECFCVCFSLVFCVLYALFCVIVSS